MYQDYSNGKLDCALNNISLEVEKLLSMESKKSLIRTMQF